ncbi:exodeoxyribonuclease VII small subunit [Lacicoccus alkaliphilus]|uniref:Exodeoxyribonuclease 7 small subunit n=1 Tax=Lacicoccus alkaliphilus DSM 16010 TaxID=1123231 RepID=A0A1M7BGZ2_9BACL|nr:exodeoxyribonuclease VII small subunit [Salinicoccus alkaliphilus]SHL53879.1 Exodeoxyribonuclease VII small subunit [Salinicoccus alkaliphilus DSM 16010]
MNEQKTETFEEKMNRLDEIVQALEKDDVPLEKSLELYKQGIELSRECERILKDAELKVETLNKDTDNEE